MPPARTSRHKQILLFDTAPCPILPQWGGHGGLGPRLSRLVRVLHLVAEQPQALENPQWWFRYGTQAMGTSSLYWVRALKLVDLLEDGSYRLSSNGQRLMKADPYLEGLGRGGGTASPLLWVLH